jgi:hypothetical protein
MVDTPNQDTSQTSETKDYLGMSDDDFMSINSPDPSVATTSSNEEDEEDAGSVVVVEPVVADVGATETDAETVVKAVEQDGGQVDDEDTEADIEKAGVAKKPVEKPAGEQTKNDAGSDVVKPEKTAEIKAVDYEGFFKQVMAPFKANGREIKLTTPDEAIRLMQMGAGYGRKLQDLQPALKTLRMLEKNDLLDETKLSFLIDINKKNPEAIKKLIAESGIDPLDFDNQDNVSYTPTNHSVSDKEMAFQTTLKDVESSRGGTETIRLVNQTWDQESKAALWDQPEILKVMQSQRENGIYDQIVAEIDRQKLLGDISSNTPFLQAYQSAGDKLFPKATIQNRPGDTPPNQVIATRTAAPKAQVQNGSKAAAAASTKTTTQRKAGVTINPLDMADDDFLKTFKDRL